MKKIPYLLLRPYGMDITDVPFLMSMMRSQLDALGVGRKKPSDSDILHLLDCIAIFEYCSISSEYDNFAKFAYLHMDKFCFGTVTEDCFEEIHRNG